ncbi:unnamed protein product [Paramecium octaurelia]|uniref:Uncharacterized protein n=1 Tax=Paramecium octaurelia TaxID=43137 RepID=A0A8S1V0Z9_PAROT|nr:unnamed protein product [Paramecium octaurelia]
MKERSRANAISFANVTFKLKMNQEQFQEDYPKVQESLYIILKLSEADADQIDTGKTFEMQLNEESKESCIYQSTIRLQQQSKYIYQYFRKTNDKTIYEKDFRGFKFVSDEPQEVDEWNKQWCRYNFIYSGQNLSIFSGYQAYVKEHNQTNMIRLEQISSNRMSCKEIIDLNTNPKNRQLCFIQIQLELDYQPRIINSIYNSSNLDGEKQIIDESLAITDLTKIKNFRSNLISVEFKEIDSKIRKRMENYSRLFNEVKRLKQELQYLKNQIGNKQDLQQLQNDYENKLKEQESQNEIDRIKQEQDKQQEILELKIQHQKEMKEIITDNQDKFGQLIKQKQNEFDDFKNYSEKIIQKYIEQYNNAHQKIMELEFNKVNFSSEEITIQAEDVNQLSEEEQNNLQELQKRLKIYESKVIEMKEENECIKEKLEKNNLQIKEKCMSSIVELQKCKELLETCQNEYKEKQIEVNISQEKQNRYQQTLKDFKRKLEKQENELITYQKALEDLDRKYKEEQEKNIIQKNEYQQKTKDLKKEYDVAIRDLQEQNRRKLNQQNEECKKLEEQKNQLERTNLSQIIDQEAKQKYKRIINEIPPQNQFYKNCIRFILLKKNPRQKPISVAYQEFKQIIQEISTHLNQLQEYKIKNLKDLGVQIISDIQNIYFNSDAFENLLNENFKKQICKLTLILNKINEDECIISQELKDNQNIIDLEQLTNQLSEYLTVLMKQQQEKKKYLVQKKQNKWFDKINLLPAFVILIMIVFFYYQNLLI